MPASKESESQQRLGNHPVTRIINLPATGPEQAAQTSFPAVKKADPSLRISKQKRPAESAF